MGEGIIGLKLENNQIKHVIEIKNATQTELALYIAHLEIIKQQLLSSFIKNMEWQNVS